MTKGLTIRTKSVITALRNEMRVQQRLHEVRGTGNLHEQAYGAMQAIKEIASALGISDEVNKQTEEVEK